MVTNQIELQKARYCPFCGSLLPKIQERSSLETHPYEKCPSCKRTFVAFTIEDLVKASQLLGMFLPKILQDMLPSEG